MHRSARNARNSHWLLRGVACLALVVAGCGQPPQLADNAECFSAVDALWTAIGARQPELLAACDSRLAKLHDDNSLSDPSYEHLQSIIATAKGGDWKSARASLRTFMEGQRRGR